MASLSSILRNFTPNARGPRLLPSQLTREMICARYGLDAEQFEAARLTGLPEAQAIVWSDDHGEPRQTWVRLAEPCDEWAARVLQLGTAIRKSGFTAKK